MKKIFLIILILIFGIKTNAQNKEEARVIAAVENLRLAMISGDRTALSNIVSADLSYGHSGGKIEDKTAFVEAISSGASDFVTINLSKQTVKVIGKTALVRHQLDAKTNDNGKPADVKIGIFLVWQKEGKAWKLLGRQAFKLP